MLPTSNTSACRSAVIVQHLFICDGLWMPHNWTPNRIDPVLLFLNLMNSWANKLKLLAHCYDWTQYLNSAENNSLPSNPLVMQTVTILHEAVAFFQTMLIYTWPNHLVDSDHTHCNFPDMERQWKEYEWYCPNLELRKWKPKEKQQADKDRKTVKTGSNWYKASQPCLYQQWNTLFPCL